MKNLEGMALKDKLGNVSIVAGLLVVGGLYVAGTGVVNGIKSIGRGYEMFRDYLLGRDDPLDKLED